jgi:Ca2+-binding EF-hand superfamily protein
VPITPDEPHARLAVRLIERYDVASRENPRERDHKLARFEIGIGEAAFRCADADSDGALDTEELARFLARPVPDVEIAVNVGVEKEVRTTIRGSAPDRPSEFVTQRLRSVSPDQFDLRDDRVAVEFSPRPVFSRADFDIRQNYRLLFSVSDADGNEIVDRDEAYRTGFFRAEFALMDRNQDGKLTRDEVFALVDQGLELAHSGVLIVVTDEGHALFDALDANHDRRLALRELRSALSRLPAWDLDRDGRLSEREIPQHIRVAFDHAQGAFSVGLRLSIFDEMPPTPREAGGRGWFTKMDVNHDGDLSPREFVGTSAAFRRLDRDGDGLIDADEAAHTEWPTRER